MCLELEDMGDNRAQSVSASDTMHKRSIKIMKDAGRARALQRIKRGRHHRGCQKGHINFRDGTKEGARERIGAPINQDQATETRQG